MTATASPTTERALFDCRDSWAATITELGKGDERIVAVVNDSVGSSKLGGFQKDIPERTINVGIGCYNNLMISKFCNIKHITYSST